MKDSIPTKMFDALGIGCPVLLLASGDSVNILEQSGLGESAKNLEELKNKLHYMIENYKSYENKKDDCISYIINNYSREKIANKLNLKMVEYVK